MMDLKKWEVFRNLDPIFAADVSRAYLIGKLTSENVAIDNFRNRPWTSGLVVTRNGDVYSIALNSQSLAMLGVEDVTGLLPLVPIKIEALCGLAIQDVSSGFRHVLVTISDGRVYQWGTIKVKEQNRTENKSWRRLKPEFISASLEGKRIRQIACGQAHTLILTEEGQVYAWGYNIYGQVGNGSRSSEEQPVKISWPSGFDKKIVSVACSAFVSFAVDSTGSVWSWGHGAGGALGYASVTNQLIPKMIPLDNIKKIAAGVCHVLTLTNANEVYFWGRHASEDIIVTPVKIEAQNVVDIAAMNCCTISAFKTAEGKVYFWGFAYGLLIPDPVATNFASMAELFASLDNPVMIEPAKFELNQPRLEKLRHSFDDEETADLKFSVDGKFIFAHKMVLKLCSDYFRRMFDNDWKENVGNGDVLEITDFTYEGFRTFLLYLYTDRIEPPPCNTEDAIELFKLADYYGEEDLKGRCEQQLKLLTTVRNVCKVYSVALQHNSMVLYEFAVDFIIPNLNAVLKTEEYKDMADELQKRLIQKLVDEEVFVGLRRKRKNAE